MEQNLIVIRQLPVIEDQLLAVKQSIEERVSGALSLVCTEDTYKDVKKVRSDLNKEFQELEKRRKDVKAQILKPYEAFERVYKECAGDLYASADAQLKQKISEVEAGLKSQKEDDLAAYFTEYRASLHIPEDLVTLEAAGIRVGLSDSKTALRKKAADFLDRVASDLQVIDTLATRDEVLSEYRKSYSLTGAMLIVENRHKAVEAERARREEQKARMEAEKAAAEAAAAAVLEAAASAAPQEAAQPEAAVPVPVPMQVPEAAPDHVYSTTFRVTGTLAELRALKAFLEEGEYTYEQL